MVSEDRSTNDASPDGAPKDASTDPPPTAPRWASGIPAGRIFGVPLVVSPAWVLLVLLALLVVPDTLRQHVNGLSKTGSFFGAVVLIALIYGAVLAHEASHVLVAKALDLRVGRVVLQLLGAQSEVLDDPQTPGRAYLVAAVGPLTSILLAGLGAAIGAQFEPNSIGWVLGWSFAWINGVVGAFNLLPGLPLDGGQMLRATLWHQRQAACPAGCRVGRSGRSGRCGPGRAGSSRRGFHRPHRRRLLPAVHRLLHVVERLDLDCAGASRCGGADTERQHVLAPGAHG
jgi:Zn-dependent protease